MKYWTDWKAKVPPMWHREFARLLAGRKVSQEFLDALEANPVMGYAADSELRNDKDMQALVRSTLPPPEVN